MCFHNDKQMFMAERIKILQIIGRMDRGGVETWLMHILRKIDRDQYQLDFLVHTNQPAAYDEEILQLGARILPCLSPRRPLRYARRLQRILQEEGPYDVVHSHVHHYSGWTLRVAAQAKVPIRIAHSHTSSLRTKTSIPRHCYYRLMEHWIDRHATLGLAASRKAAASLWGKDWYTDKRWRILYCSIDLKPYEQLTCNSTMRVTLGIPANSLILGYVANFIPAKNHAFLIEIMHELVKRSHQIYLLLIGDGPLRSDIEKLALLQGIRDRIIFLGIRQDVPSILMNCVDVFISPSLYEGLPVSVLEAQAAGLPVIISEAVTHEVEVIPELFTWLSVAQPSTDWATACLTAGSQTRKITQQNAVQILTHSPFNIQRGIEEIETVYAADKHA